MSGYVVQERERDFVEEVGLFFEEMGGVRMMGRVLGWLLICDPPHQSSSQLADALVASRGSISTATRMLMQAGLVEKMRLAGDRGHYFRIRAGAWTTLLQSKLASIAMFRELAERGLAVLEDDGATQTQTERLREFRDLYAFMEREFPALIERWTQQKDEP